MLVAAAGQDVSAAQRDLWWAYGGLLWHRTSQDRPMEALETGTWLTLTIDVCIHA